MKSLHARTRELSDSLPPKKSLVQQKFSCTKAAMRLLQKHCPEMLREVSIIFKFQEERREEIVLLLEKKKTKLLEITR